MEKRKIIAIVGPTASGKTGWGVAVARKYNGEIISADSRQVYRGLDIGTGKDGSPAKPGISNSKFLISNEIPNSKNQISKQYNNITIQQLQKSIRCIDGIPQWLIDIVEPETNFTMFDWLERARAVIEEIFSRGKTPIIVGGTGLYVQALVEGFQLEKSPGCHPELDSGSGSRNKFGMTKKYDRKELEKKSLEELQKIFSKLEIRNLKLDIDPNNPHRLIRAIEREQSGEIISKKKPNFEVLQIAVDLPREILYQRIDQRAGEWFEEGFVEEVQGLLDNGVKLKWLEKIGLEYRILSRYLLCHPHAGGDPLIVDSRLRGNDKNKNVDDKEFFDMKQKMKFAIHAFARRQLTWFRRFPEIIWCKDIESAEKEIKKFLV